MDKERRSRSYNKKIKGRLKYNTHPRANNSQFLNKKRKEEQDFKRKTLELRHPKQRFKNKDNFVL